jgi:bifunctional non-homologous end joining protein LigD
MERNGRFVVQRHERQGSPVHWDLMLEAGEVLETFRIGRPIEEWGTELIDAVKIFDHPLKFLTYEGLVNKGKGNVTIAETGTYHLVTRDENKLTLEFSGKILKGGFIFVTGGDRVRRG